MRGDIPRVEGEREQGISGVSHEAFGVGGVGRSERESRMLFVILIPIVGLLLLLVIVARIVESRQSRIPHNEPSSVYKPLPPEKHKRNWLISLTQEPDVLAELVKYIRLVDAGIQDRSIGSEVIEWFLQEYGSRGALNSDWEKFNAHTPDPVIKLRAYIREAELGHLDSYATYKLAEDFLNELCTSDGICEVGPFNAVLPFDPRIHRGLRDGEIGELIRVTRPGWMIDNEIVKYPMVQRERNPRKT